MASERLSFLRGGTRERGFGRLNEGTCSRFWCALVNGFIPNRWLEPCALDCATSLQHSFAMSEEPWTLVTIPASTHASMREIDQDQTRQALWQSFDSLDVGSQKFTRPLFKLGVRMAELHRKHRAANPAAPGRSYIPPTDAEVDG